MDHNWPDELSVDAVCSACGLRYYDYTAPEHLNCPGEEKKHD